MVDYYLVLVFAITIVLGAIGGYVIILIRSLHRTLEKVDRVLDTIQQTTASAGKTAEEADSALKLLNERLPAILEDLGQTAASARTIGENTEVELRKGINKQDDDLDRSLAVAANLGNYVLKGYSVWKKIRKSHFLS